MALSPRRCPLDEKLALIDETFDGLTAGLVRSKRLDPTQIGRQSTQANGQVIAKVSFANCSPVSHTLPSNRDEPRYRVQLPMLLQHMRPVKFLSRSVRST